MEQTNIVLTEFNKAFTIGRKDTSSIPSIPAGLGPKIRNATAKVMTMETM